MKKLLTMMLMLLPMLSWGETPAEGVAKYPDATFFYCKKKTWKGTPPMSPIERVAFMGGKGKFYIKFFGQEDDMECRILGQSEDIENVTFFPLSNGAIGIDTADECIVWGSPGSTVVEVFEMDMDKTYEALRLK